MKDLMLLVGFGAGMITGMVLYKYSKSAKQVFNKGETAVMETFEKGEKKIEKEADKLKKGAEKVMKEAEEKMEEGTEKIKKKLKTK